MSLQERLLGVTVKKPYAVHVKRDKNGFVNSRFICREGPCSQNFLTVFQTNDVIGTHFFTNEDLSRDMIFPHF